tara:strand:- start:87 stop:743 length:657 start_codon:yes stop_codon:yes gene_type:complete
MKKILLILLFIPIVYYGQGLNKESNGYTEVVEVKLSKKDIHQKINEWVAINFKSAQDVVQLNSEDKVIVKGNYPLNMQVSANPLINTPNYNFTYRISNTMLFSIRDNKYKIDLIPISAWNDLIGEAVLYDFPSWMSPKTMSKEEFIKISYENAIKAFFDMGYSEKKAKKLMASVTDASTNEINYNDYIINKAVWSNTIKSLFQSVKDYVNQSNSDDDW